MRMSLTIGRVTGRGPSSLMPNGAVLPNDLVENGRGRGPYHSFGTNFLGAE